MHMVSEQYPKPKHLRALFFLEKNINYLLWQRCTNILLLCHITCACINLCLHWGNRCWDKLVSTKDYLVSTFIMDIKGTSVMRTKRRSLWTRGKCKAPKLMVLQPTCSEVTPEIENVCRVTPEIESVCRVIPWSHEVNNTISWSFCYAKDRNFLSKHFHSRNN